MKSLFWLSYHCEHGPFGAVILEARDLLEARMLVALNGIDKGAHFSEGYPLSVQCAAMISAGSLDRMLPSDEADRLLVWIESEAARKGIPARQA